MFSKTITAALLPLALLTANACLAAAKSAAPATPPTTAPAGNPAIEQWRTLGYGMFIHYGMATFTRRANENDPQNAAAPATLYAPDNLDVDQWIRVARDAGMKYAVLTAKHSAGHCLWDSKVQFRGKEFDYDVATSGDKTDVVAEFVTACKKYGLMPGLYWCLEDHRNKSKPSKQQRTPPLPDEFFQFAQDQLTELIQRYPEVNYYWLDIPVAANAAQRQTLYDLIKRLRPATIVLFNHGAAKPQGPMTIAGCLSAWPTDVFNTELWPLQSGWFQPSQTWQGQTYPLGYEHCDTIGKRWFWVEGDLPRPVVELAKLHRQVRACGGNLLLNVPPDPAGRIPDYHVKALMELKKALDHPSPSQAAVNASGKSWLKPDATAMKRWQDMRFGMFICWGPVTLTGKEIGWSRGKPTPIAEYDSLYKKWNPEKFNAEEWVQVAQDTGARYIVFLLKHHDGFCLFDTKFTDYNIMNGPFKRDIAREMADACHKAGIGFFPYYSTCDWHHPDFPLTSPGGKVKRNASNLEHYTEYLEAQTKELITKYGPLTGIWFDVPQAFDKVRGERVIRHVRALQPDIIVNNRTGAPGDFDTPEQNVGVFSASRPWESCITLGTQWTWKPDDKLKSYTEAIRMLAVCAVNNGNLALNTNPMPDGQIEPRQVESFKKIGEWLAKYGESIYGTRGGPFIAPDWKERSFNTDREHFSVPGGNWWGGSTHKGSVVYLHILRWPGDTIQLPAIKQKIVKHSVLTGGEATVKQTDAGIEVFVPAVHRDATDTIIKLELDAPAKHGPVG